MESEPRICDFNHFKLNYFGFLTIFIFLLLIGFCCFVIHLHFTSSFGICQLCSLYHNLRCILSILHFSVSLVSYSFLYPKYSTLFCILSILLFSISLVSYSFLYPQYPTLFCILSILLFSVSLVFYTFLYPQHPTISCILCILHYTVFSFHYFVLYSVSSFLFVLLFLLYSLYLLVSVSYVSYSVFVVCILPARIDECSNRLSVLKAGFEFRQFTLMITH